MIMGFCHFPIQITVTCSNVQDIDCFELMVLITNDGVGDLEDFIGFFFGGACQFESNCQRFPKKRDFSHRTDSRCCWIFFNPGDR